MRSGAKLQKIELIAVQCHPRSSTLVPIESAHATSYYLLVLTLVVSRIVFEISTHKDITACFHHPTLVWRPRSGGTHRNFWIKLASQKL